MKDFKCPQCGGELSCLENQPFTICDYCGSKAILPDMPQVIRNVIVQLSDERFILVRGEKVKISPYVGDNDIEDQAELLEEMYRLISIGEFDEAKKLVYVVDRMINIYNSAFIALQRVGMIMIKFNLKTEEELLKRTRPINDENLAYIIKGSSIFADKIVAYNERLEFRNKKEMIEKVNASAKEYFYEKANDNSQIRKLKKEIAEVKAEIEECKQKQAEQEYEKTETEVVLEKKGFFGGLFNKKAKIEEESKDEWEEVQEDYGKRIKMLQEDIEELLEEIDEIINDDTKDYSYDHYKNSVESDAKEFSKTHDVKDVYFDTDDERMSSRKDREDYKDFNVPNEEVFDFYSMFES